MMIFLLANIICCNITSVLLSIVDYRQVRHPTDCLCIVLFVNCTDAVLTYFVFCHQGSTLNKATKGTDKGERDSDKESLNKVENEKNGAIYSCSSSS